MEWLTSTHNSSSKKCNTLLWSLWSPGTHVLHIHTDRQNTHTIRYKILKQKENLTYIHNVLKVGPYNFTNPFVTSMSPICHPMFPPTYWDFSFHICIRVYVCMCICVLLPPKLRFFFFDLILYKYTVDGKEQLSWGHCWQDFWPEFCIFCVWVWHSCTCVWTFTGVWRPGLILGTFLNRCPPCRLRQELSLNLDQNLPFLTPRQACLL